jgi:hypothetical protein
MLTGDPHAAEDLVQVVLVKAHPRWGRISGLDRPLDNGARRAQISGDMVERMTAVVYAGIPGGNGLD